jgi:head-tail adaptor
MKLAHKLKHRIQICEGIQDPNSTGGFDRTYKTLTTVWAGIEIMSEYLRSMSRIRGGNDSDGKSPTHRFIVRWAAVQNMGKEMNSAFSSGFNSIADLIPLKSDMFVFMEVGSQYKGRLFQIMDIYPDEQNKEFIKFTSVEIEEKGTGYPE